MIQQTTGRLICSFEICFDTKIICHVRFVNKKMFLFQHRDRDFRDHSNRYSKLLFWTLIFRIVLRFDRYGIYFIIV